ncbi:hypothetical protein HPB50_015044 [Hyalomma asiaticum]|uniref:Uncharacterized protein n=1 Tax=Hyalomma asiaticum TaxID=266040 RepID=A0ACB7SQE3_HYAAI|nr:hypothetical protein HPB50_015044 [Hyalomma asiaticum]
MERRGRPFRDSAECAQTASLDVLPPMEAVRKRLDANFVASSALKVYLRIRPQVGGQNFTCPAFQPCGDKVVEFTTAALEHRRQKRFSFTKVFPEGSSQEQLFREAVQAPVDAFINGANVLLFTYGPTCGGKTYTMQGPPTDPGIVPRTLDRLFNLLGHQVCKGAPVRPDCFDDFVQLSEEEQAFALLQKTKLLGEKSARSAADFSTFHLPANDSDGSLFLSNSGDCSYSDRAQVMQAYFTTGGQVSLIVNICPAMSMLEESLNALEFSAVAIEVVPLQLESRHTRCKEAVRRLTERWHNASGSAGLPADPVASPAKDVAVAAALDADEAEELFETIEALQRDMDDMRGQLEWEKKMVAAKEAQVNDYKALVKDLERALRQQRESADEEMAIRVKNAIEITKLELFRKAEQGSTLELLKQLEEAQRRIAELEEEPCDRRSTVTTAAVETQTEEFDTGSAAAPTLEEQNRLMKAESEMHDLRSRFEESQSRLVIELQARKDAEVSVKEARKQLADVQQKLCMREVQQEGLERRLEELQQANDNMQKMAAELNCELERMHHDKQECELSVDVLREQLVNTTEALHEAEDKAKEEAARRAASSLALEQERKTIAEELAEARRLAHNAEESWELRLKEAHDELESCREKLLASEQSRQAAMASLEAKEEQLSSLQQAVKSAAEQEEVADENCPRHTRHAKRNTQRRTRATRSKAQSLASSEVSDSEADFKPPRRTPRRTKKSVAFPEDQLEEKEDRGSRAVLAEDNAVSSPFGKRIGDLLAGVLSIGTGSGVAAQTRTRRQLTATDAGFVELQDEQSPPTRRTAARRKAKQ